MVTEDMRLRESYALGYGFVCGCCFQDTDHEDRDEEGYFCRDCVDCPRPLKCERLVACGD